MSPTDLSCLSVRPPRGGWQSAAGPRSCCQSVRSCVPIWCDARAHRNPIHVNVKNDVFGNDTGVPPQMSGLATKLKGAGYRTIAAGKWHAGMQHPAQTPRGRGYDAALTYFNPDNDYWANTYSDCPTGGSDGLKSPVVDLWEATEGGGEGPAYTRNNSCPYRTFIPFNGCMDELGACHQPVVGCLTPLCGGLHL